MRSMFRGGARLRRTVCLAALAASFQATAAFAQDSIAGEEIIVTATRRAESVLEVPLSIVAADRERLDRDRIEDVSDLARAVPGLSLRGAWGGTAKIAIRGIASNVGAATTGIYLDETPIHVRPLGAADIVSNTYPEIFDLDRVEVLRGPQGTLFGQGSEGGTVRFITPHPSLTDSEYYAKASLSATEGGELGFLVGGAASLPLVTDALGLRVSGMVRRDGGWIDRAPIAGADAGGEDVNRRTGASLRAALRWDPAANVSLTPSLFWQHTKRRDTEQYWEALSDPSEGQFVSGQPLRQPAEDRFLLPALKGEVEFGWATLLSNTSWFDRAHDSTVDYTIHTVEGLTQGLLTLVPGVPDFAAPSTFEVGQQVFSQELRLQSPDGHGRFDWTAGLFYSNARQSVDQVVEIARLPEFGQIVLGCPQLVFCFGQGLLPGDVAYFGRDRSGDRQYAAFGQLDWRALDRITVTLGARLTRNRNDFSNDQDGPLNFGPSATAGEVKDTVLTPRLGISYEPSSRLLFYATAAKGARPGGGNTAVPAAFCAADLAALGLQGVPQTYEGDHVWTYEAGAKGSAAGGAASWQLSAFHTDWSGIQQSIALPNCGFAYTANLGSAVSRGFDGQIEVRPADGLKLAASVAYTDAHYTDTVSTSAGTRLSSEGDKLPIPAWQLRLSAAYDRPLGRFDAGVQLDYEHASGYRRVPSAPAFLHDPLNERAEAVDHVTLQARLGTARWEGSLFVENLLDSHDAVFRTHDSPFAPTFRRQSLRPRTFGAQILLRM